MQRLLLLVALSLSGLSARATVYYVNGSRPDNAGAGTSWATAKRDVQAAIYSATADGDEVWVKAGTYLPTLDTNGLVPANGSDRTFDISFRNIKLYGGFAGSETASGQRNPAANATILSGDLDSSGTATAGDANTVLRTIARSAACVVDGFTVTRGIGYTGAGMYNYNSSTTINNCIFTANTNGSGMRNYGGGPTVTNCTFTGNTASSAAGGPGAGGGGGIWNYYSNLAITNCTISGNTAIRGGGMYSYYNSNGSLTVTNCTISANTAADGGGGMYSYYNLSGGHLTVTNSTISGNTAAVHGGGMYSFNGELTVTNCTISGNTTAVGRGGGMYHLNCGYANVTNCIISGNTAIRGGGMYNESTYHTIIRCVFSNNACNGSGGSGGGMYNAFCLSSEINTCVFSGNSCSDTAVNDGSTGLNNGGGGIYTYAPSGTSVLIVHCTLYGNIAATGGGIYLEGSSPGSKSMRNCILYNNTTYNPTGNANNEELRVVTNGGNGSSLLAVYNSIIRDYSNATSNYSAVNVTSNSGGNPGLVDTTTPAGADGQWLTADDGLRIDCSSVAKDAGNVTASATSTDAIGNPRQGTVDIGAYEAQGISTAAATTLPSVTTAVAGAPTANVTTYYTDCNNTVAAVFPTGTAPVSGPVIAKVTVLASVPTTAGGQPYVQRTYDIIPSANAAAATATVTLYFTQAEFTAYNAVRGSYPSLPVNNADTANYRANLRITQKHGTSASGLPDSYSGSSVLITPSTVTYNAAAQSWEVTFPVTGFSGFFAHTAQANTPLPLALTGFTARAAGSANGLSWSAFDAESSAFTVERSITGSSFTGIGTVRGNKGSDYSFTDEAPAAISYYRLRILAESGQETYSQVALVRRSGAGSGTVTLAPQPAASFLTVTNTDASLNGGTAVVLDIRGREVVRFTVAPSVMLDLSGWAPGLYALRLASGKVLRLIRQ